MDEQKKGNSTIVWTVSVIVVALIAFGGYKYISSSNATVVGNPNPITTGTNPPPQGTSVYKDGSYTATGSYMSPGGQESLGVNLTLKSDVVTDVTATSEATRSESKQYQARFISGYKALVVGKKIQDINIIKVSGSSLTPIGFMDALSQIETQAKA